MINVTEIVNRHANTRSDINEHIPTLLKYAEECDHIIEMGVRKGVSLWALLGGGPKRLIAYDIQNPSKWGGNIGDFYEAAKQHNIEFEFIQKNVLEVEIEETDFLFLDTWHAYKQLKAELKLHANKVKKYIAFHDTTNYEFRDEGGYEELGPEWVGDGRGIWPAIEEFLEENNDWKLKERFTNNNGLTIIERV